MFEIEGKIALISGGASGIGFKVVQELLRKGLKGITIADINEELGKKCLEEIQNQFGPNRAIFVKTDVTNYNNYEEAFKQTIEQFKNLDILINSAGLVLSGSDWDKLVAVNLNGVINGTFLGLENYIKKHKSGSEGVIVNLASVAGVVACPSIPIYSATKFGVVGLSISLGHELHYNDTKIKVVAVCPGMTNTPLVKPKSHGLGPRYQTINKKTLALLPLQSSDTVAAGLVEVVQNAKSGTIWIVENDKNPYEFKLASREDYAPK